MNTFDARLTFPSNGRHRPHKWAFSLWLLYLLLIPFYVGPSGGVQPSTLVLLGSFFALLWGGGFRLLLSKSAVRPALTLPLLLGYIFLVCLFWSIRLSSPNLLLPALFYTFNGIAFLTGASLLTADPERFLRVTRNGLVTALLLQVGLSFFLATTWGFRGTLFFNNPNQLGFYSLLSAVILAGLHLIGHLSNRLLAVALACCAYLALLSASRAAIASVVVLVILSVVRNLKMAVLLSAVTLAGAQWISVPSTDGIRRRFESPDDSVLDRGYDRIFEFPEYLAFGAGEGALYRFNTPIELHSLFGTVLFCYGIPGVVTILFFVFSCLRGVPRSIWLLFVPVAIYSTSHHTLRTTLMWITLLVPIAYRHLSSSNLKPMRWSTKAPSRD